MWPPPSHSEKWRFIGIPYETRNNPGEESYLVARGVDPGRSNFQLITYTIIQMWTYLILPKKGVQTLNKRWTRFALKSVFRHVSTLMKWVRQDTLDAAQNDAELLVIDRLRTLHVVFCCPKVSRSDERIWWNTNFHVFSSISRVVWWMYAEDHRGSMWNQKTVERADGNYVINTVDRGNPPPVDVLDFPVFTGFHTSQVFRRISSINSMTHVGKQLAWPPDSPPILVPHSQAKISLALGC